MPGSEIGNRPWSATLLGPERKGFEHRTPKFVRRGCCFFVTVCCRDRGLNRLCRPDVGARLLDAAGFYHERGDWFCRIFLLMPDHVHALISPAPDLELGALVGQWKRFTRSRLGIKWQKNFIDHRIRTDESLDEKARYIRANPVRAGLVRAGESWLYMFEN